MKSRKFQLIKLFAAKIVLLVMAFAISGCQGSSQPSLSADKKRELANALYNQQLFPQAIQEYEEYLRFYDLDENEQGNISYQIANIYFEKVRDYENALAYYTRAKHLHPNANFQQQLGKRVVECLERLQRSTDARQVIAQQSALNDTQKPPSRPGEVLAKIGDREITSGDLAFQMNQLPEYLQAQIQQEPGAKADFLKQYIAQELLYDSAKRMGLDEDKEVLEGLHQAKKSLMSERLLRDELEKESGIDKYENSDVETYYKANQERYAERDDKGNVKQIKPFSEVAQQVAQDFVAEKKQQAYQRIIERLMKAEQVVVYEDKIK